MINAHELLKQQKERESIKNLTFEKIYDLIQKKIYLASMGNFYHTWYQIPEFILGLPTYSIQDCQTYITNKLKKNNFETDFYEPNIIFISWNLKKSK